MSDEIEVGQVWRHKKRGSSYEIVATDAAIQVSSLPDEVGGPLEDEDWIAYRPVDGHRLFFRMREEFLDGRFEQVAAGCGDPNCRDPNCEYGKGPSRCPSCGGTDAHTSGCQRRV